MIDYVYLEAFSVYFQFWSFRSFIRVLDLLVVFFWGIKIRALVLSCYIMCISFVPALFVEKDFYFPILFWAFLLIIRYM